MKFKSFLFALGLLALSLYAAEIEWEVYWDSDSKVKFDTVVIGRVLDNTASPENDSGLYVGYAGTEGYWLGQRQKLPSARYEQIGTTEIEDFGNTAGYYYFMELYAGDLIVGYSNLASYDVLLAAIHIPGAGAYEPWVIDSINPATVPEPSSGLLLLIGGALVGLRRKRRIA